MSSSSSSDGLGDALFAAVEDTIAALKAQMEASSSRRRGPRRYIHRDREDAHTRLLNDYFTDNCIYPPNYFRRRYRMRRSLFLRITERLGEYSSYFTERVDATGRRGLSPLQKCTAALRLLAYGIAADSIDEYLKLGKSTALECLENFCEGIIECYGLNSIVGLLSRIFSVY